MIASVLLAMLQAAPAPAAPAWTFRQTNNAETGARSASASIRDPDNGARLVFKCDVVDVPVISVQFIPKPPLAPGDPQNVTITLDSSKAEFGTWQLPGSGAYFDDPYSLFIYATEFAKAKEIQIGLLDNAGKPIGGTFVGPGDAAMFRQVYAACGIPYELPSTAAAAKSGQ